MTRVDGAAGPSPGRGSEALQREVEAKCIIFQFSTASGLTSSILYLLA